MLYHSAVGGCRHSLFTVLMLLVAVGCMDRVKQAPSRWTVYELDLTSSQEYDNPFWDAAVRVELTAPSGKKHLVDAFWDGGRTWRLRFAPDEVGRCPGKAIVPTP